MDFESGFGMGRQILSDIHQRNRDAAASERDEASAKLIKQEARDLRLKNKAKKEVGGYNTEARSDKKLAKLAPKEKRIELKGKKAAAKQAMIKAKLEEDVNKYYGETEHKRIGEARIQQEEAAPKETLARAQLTLKQAENYDRETDSRIFVNELNAQSNAITAEANRKNAATDRKEYNLKRNAAQQSTDERLLLDMESEALAAQMADPPKKEDGSIDFSKIDAWARDIYLGLTELSASSSSSPEVRNLALATSDSLSKGFGKLIEDYKSQTEYVNRNVMLLEKGKLAQYVQKNDQGERLERMRNLHGKQGEDDVHTRVEVLEMFRSKGVPLSYLRRDSKEFNSIFAFEQSEAMPFQILKDKDGGEYSSIDHPIMLIDRTATLASAQAFADKWVAENAPPKAETENRDGVPLKSAMSSFDMGAPTTGNTTTTRRVGGNLQTTGTPIGSELYPHSKAVDVQSFLSGWESGQPLVGGSFLDGPTAPPTGDSEPMVEGSPAMPELPQTPPPAPAPTPPTEPTESDRELMQDSGINEKQAGILDDLGIDWRNSSIGGKELVKRESDRIKSDIESKFSDLQKLKDRLSSGVKVVGSSGPFGGGAGSTIRLTPKEKSDIRKSISSMESEIKQMRDQKAKLDPSVKPKDVKIPEGARGLLRKLETTRRLAEDKRREANENPEPVGVTGARPNSSMIKEAEALEAQALELERQLEGLPEENQSLIKSKRRFPAPPPRRSYTY